MTTCGGKSGAHWAVALNVLVLTACGGAESTASQDGPGTQSQAGAEAMSASAAGTASAATTAGGSGSATTTTTSGGSVATAGGSAATGGAGTTSAGVTQGDPSEGPGCDGTSVKVSGLANGLVTRVCESGGDLNAVAPTANLAVRGMGEDLEYLVEVGVLNQPPAARLDELAALAQTFGGEESLRVCLPADANVSPEEFNAAYACESGFDSALLDIWIPVFAIPAFFDAVTAEMDVAYVQLVEEGVAD